MVTKNAFSLIELIVVIGLLSLLMLAISSTMLMSLVSSNRIRTTTKIKQAGNYAIGQMQSMIRSAKSVVECKNTSDTTNPYITLVNPDGDVTTLSSELDDAGYTHVASNSGIYLTPTNTDLGTSFSLNCEPDADAPNLVKISFDLKESSTNTPTSHTPNLHFETSVNIRNE